LNELYQNLFDKSSQDHGSIRKIQDGQTVLLGCSWGCFSVRNVQGDDRSGDRTVVSILNMEPVRQAFLMGYAYAMGMWYARRHSRLAVDSDFRESDHPRDKDGKFAKSGEGNKSSIGKTFPNTGKNLLERKPSRTPEQYLHEARGNVRRAIVDYYDNELRGGYVDTRLEMNGKMVPVRVEFDANARTEFRKFGGESDLILDAVAASPDIIASGKYAGRRVEKDHSPQVAFHTKIKKVMTRRGMKLVAVDIGEDKGGNVYAYSVNTEGTRSFSYKLKKLQSEFTKRKSGRDSVLLPSSKDSATFYAPATVIQPLIENSIGMDAVKIKYRVMSICVI
jgi:hypothetical protein